VTIRAASSTSIDRSEDARLGVGPQEAHLVLAGGEDLAGEGVKSSISFR
jgi:hypothetical protein